MMSILFATEECNLSAFLLSADLQSKILILMHPVHQCIFNCSLRVLAPLRLLVK